MKISKILTTIAVCSLAFTASSCKNKQAKTDQQYDAYGNPYGQQQAYGGSDYVNVTPTQQQGYDYNYNYQQQQPQQTAYQEPAAYSAPAPAPAASAGSNYTVRSGDNLYRIGLNHGVSVNQLKSANGLSSDIIQPGDVLTIP